MALNQSIMAVALVILMGSCNSSKKTETSQAASTYKVTGYINGIEDGTIYLKKNEVLTRTTQIIDSTVVDNGKFEFSGTTEAPDQVFIQKDDNVMTFFLENTDIDIKADATKPREKFAGMEATIKGSNLNDLYLEQLATEKSIMNKAEYSELIKLQKEYNEAQQAKDRERSKEIYEELEKLQSMSNERTEELLNAKLMFVNKYPNSAVSPQVLGYMFSERDFNLNDMSQLMATFSGDAKNTSMYRYFNNEYQAIKRTSPGAKAPDFTLKTPSGEDFSLSDIKDKYILIDFWASWCKPCRASYPHLKEVYSKYKDKGFEVLAVSTDSDHEAWKKAIKEDQTSWIHVVDTFNRPGFPSDIGTLYAVPFLPTTYLLDKNGVVIDKNLHADELDAKMLELFGF